MARIDELVDGVYRISIPPREAPITFNQFLIDDERPALIHTGVYSTCEETRRAIAEVLDPARLAYVVLLHFEGDECGRMDRVMAAAPTAELVGCELSVVLNLRSFGVDFFDRVHGVRDGDAIELGRHTLYFLETPHVHHWDSMMVFEQKTRGLFPADLFIQPGDQPPVVGDDLGREMCRYYREIGIFAHEEPVRNVVDRVERLDPDWIHAMHGGTIGRDLFPRFVRAQREARCAFGVSCLGRRLDDYTETSRS